ncbi:MAG: Hpt domain-containing protein [Bacteroidia bacterium]
MKDLDFKNNIEKEHSYNLTELIQLSNGNNDFLANMIEIFVRSSSEIISKMQNELENNEWQKVGLLAHKAVPSFHFMGIDNLAEKLKFIEVNAVNIKEHNHIRQMIGFIDKNMYVILEELEKEIKKYKSIN